MRIVMFAGGVGSRLWPVSRKNSPKQFEKIIGDKSMLQIAVGKLFPDFTWEDIYISTGKQYQDMVQMQLPDLPDGHVMIEPEMRDVGPAVGLITAQFVKTYPDEPIALLWGSDHLVRKEDLFRRALKAAEKMITEDKNKIIFVGQKPRFANQNVGYIEFGLKEREISGLAVHQFKSFQYRPHLSQAEQYLKDGHHAWNLGYFVTTPRFLWKLFAEFSPELFSQLQKIHQAVGTNSFEHVLQAIYPTVEKISFDNAVLEKMNPKYGSVISVDLGWSDIGAWEALKEALSKSDDENVVRGNVLIENSVDSLIFNYNKQQLVVGIDMSDMVIVNTNDVLLICPKDSVPKVKEIVKNLEGTDHEHLA